MDQYDDFIDFGRFLGQCDALVVVSHDFEQSLFDLFVVSVAIHQVDDLLLDNLELTSYVETSTEHYAVYASQREDHQKE
jgi:hypothetical protein